ncbi:MAG TPA: hybrid sensor histidine kinase/response regulator, partial [Polyangia bacterium]|nr:hybrid sensor histidine kinase/response regulator [Polyangia bacterium]
MAARILMVDDVESNLVALEAVLYDPAVTLVRARSGPEALRALLEDDYSLILLDVQMPEMDGFDTAALIRERPKTKTTPIIFVTAHGATAELTLKAYSVGAVDFLTKPFEPQVLRAKVSAFIDSARRLDEAKIQAELFHQQRLREERQRWEADALRAQVTEERRTASEERAARRDAEAANQLKDEFLATLSHELRTPLNAILGWLSVLKANEVDRAKRDRGLSVIERNARLQAKLIEDMLDISRIVAGKLRIEEQEVRLPDVVERVIEGARPDAESRNVTLAARFAEEVPPISGDPDRLGQVLGNLLSNAIKFTPRGGHVDVQLRAVGGTAELRVEDSGKGIDPGFLPRVFDRFRQGDGATNRSHGGLGIGLSIARHLVELHGGTIRAESDGLGKGS